MPVNDGPGEIQNIEQLANQLIKRFGKSEAIKTCQSNKWRKVLNYIKTKT